MVSNAKALLPVMHVMRTYGSHGGEQQLSQYFGAQPHGEIQETFAFVYRDDECAELFRSRALGLVMLNLIPWPVGTGGAWRELFFMLPMLPWLFFRFAWALARHRPEVCVVHGFQAALVVWPSAVLFRRLRWIYVHRIAKSSIGRNRLFRMIYRPYDVVAGNSQAVTASLSSLVEPSRLQALDNGLDLQKFDARADLLLAPVPEKKGIVLGVVGRLLPHKGQTFLIEVLERLEAKYSDVTLWIVGDGSDMETLRYRGADLITAGRIHFLGRREDVPAVLQFMDIFVNASSWEGMSNAVLEGMAASLPSVVVDAPGVTECHVQGVTGFIVKRDAEEFALVLSRLLGDANGRKHMGAAARARVKEYYSIEASRKRYLKTFKRLTGRAVCAEF